MSMEECAEELLDRYNSATNIKEIAVCAEQMADFLEDFLNKK